MLINFENALGIHSSALRLRSQRASVLANNLANADTPNFKARDIDFQGLLTKAIQGKTVPGGASNMDITRNTSMPSNISMTSTHKRHQVRTSNTAFISNDELFYRTPNQPSIDGNTVEEHVEHVAYTKNALAFQASFRFLDGAFKGLKTAIRGEL